MKHKLRIENGKNRIMRLSSVKSKIWVKNCFYAIKVIIDSVNALWLNKRHIEEQLGHKNLPAVTNKYDKIYQKTQIWISRWTNKTTKWKIFKYWFNIKNNNGL